MPIPPGFSANRLSLLDRGFACAIAHIRGGDDLGYRWYLDGKLEKRTNTFNDFVDVTRFLIAQGFAAPGRVTAAGGSAGGELMGAIVNQAPELYGAVAAHVPFVDVLNTMLDGTLPLTPGEWSEWGNPIEDKAAFDFIRSYSPYDNVTAQAYPAMLVTAGLSDPRVTYWEPAKWVAKLRATKTDRNLLLLKTNMGAGHGGKSGRYVSLEEAAEEYAFLITQVPGQSEGGAVRLKRLTSLTLCLLPFCSSRRTRLEKCPGRRRGHTRSASKPERRVHHIVARALSGRRCGRRWRGRRKAARRGPTYLDCGHETMAVAMATGYTHVTGRMQAVLLHAGAGLLQGSMAIYGARAMGGADAGDVRRIGRLRRRRFRSRPAVVSQPECRRRPAAAGRAHRQDRAAVHVRRNAVSQRRARRRTRPADAARARPTFACRWNR